MAGRCPCLHSRISLPFLPVVLATILAIVFSAVPHAEAGCNLIPGTEKTFNSTLGATNRPFAAPGEPIELRVRPCDTDSPGLSASPSDQVVTVVFPGSTPPSAAVLTAAADCSAITPKLAACESQLGVGGTAKCIAGDTAGVGIVERDGVRYLRFRFPNTDDLLLGANDGFTLSGAAKIAVSAPADPLPCALATADCSAQSGLIACIDDYFANDGVCGTATPNSRFPSFTALPLPNDYRADCFRTVPPCSPSASELRAALDKDGNMLVPFAWSGILVQDQAVPVPRLLRTQLESPVPFQIPDQVFLGSYTPEGGKLPPIFEPQNVVDPDLVTLFGSTDAPYTILRVGKRHGTCSGGDNDGQRCSTAVDCPGGSCPTTCVGDPGTACTTDADCGGNGPCGRLFDLNGVALGGGLLVLPRTVPAFCQDDSSACMDTSECMPGPEQLCVSYGFQAELPVDLSSLSSGSDELRSFIIDEAVDNTSRNGDPDATDSVVTLRDRVTGERQPLGAPAGCGLSGTAEGRAVVRISDPPFTFPAVASEGDTVAFLESEVDQNRCFENGDEDFADAILRIFRLSAGETAVSPVRAVDAALALDGQPLRLSNGRAFVRTSEAAMAKRATERVSVGAGAVEGNGDSGNPSISVNGRYVAFWSWATNLIGMGADTNSSPDVFVRDRTTGTTERVSVSTSGVEANSGSLYSSISADGRYVAFESDASNLIGPGVDTNGFRDVFVRDRMTGTTERVSVSTSGLEGDSNTENGTVSISPDGRYVLFTSPASNLLGPGNDTNNCGFPGPTCDDVFVHDRQTGVTERVSVGPGGAEADNQSVTFGYGGAFFSADSRFVVFSSLASNLLGPGEDTNGQYDVFVRDRMTGTNKRVSVGPGGVEADGPSGFPSISADGRYVAFRSLATNLVGAAADTNGFLDVFVHDRLTGSTERVSVGPGGAQGNDNCVNGPAISADGRFVAFQSRATNLLGSGGDTDGIADVFVYDRVTRTTERVNVGPGGIEEDGTLSVLGGISGDERFVAFESNATNLLGPGGDTNSNADIFVRALDATDPLAIDALLFPDGALDDTVLEVVDATSGSVTTLCPAEDVSVADGNAAFLRPESATGTANCPGGSLNTDTMPVDTDTNDLVVHLWTGTLPPANLERSATAVSLAPDWLAALVSEAGDGTNYNSAGGDTDQDDTVVQLHAVADAPPNWVNTEQAADTVQMSDTVAVFITPEADQGEVLNGDGLQDDRVLQAYFAEGPSPNLVDVGQAAEEFVVGDPADTACGPRHLVAFRTSEAAQGANLNSASGDTDTDDGVLQVYDLEQRTLRNTGQAITPCSIVECDPRRPYRVDGSKVKFLTFEPDQNHLDLNGDGTNTQLILQQYDFCTNTTTTLGAVEGGNDPFGGGKDPVVFVSPAGRCDLGVTCNPDDDMCGDEMFCAHCGDGVFCEDDACNTETGSCLRHSSISCMSDADCKRCTLRQPPTCVVGGEDCPDGSTCKAQVIIAVQEEPDTDDDGVPDAQDNCPTTPNTDQLDTNGDGVGDACAPDLLTGEKLLVVDKEGRPDRRKLVILSKDQSGLTTPASGSPDAPTISGAQITLFNPTTAETDTYELPASGWDGLGNPDGVKGYKYKDTTFANGPCKKVIWKPGKILKALCKGDQIHYTLDEPSQGSMGFAFSSGSTRLCVIFGGDIKLDRPAADGKTGLFKAKDAPAAPSCPLP